jgi:3-hydroxyisobutyrate dehydrogenase-like beta-hydroxyacid dehydrogenase
LTSSSPATTVRLAEILKRSGITFLDAPVSGGVDGASSGTLTVMVGGTPADRDRIQPLLECFASTITWAGPLGSGHAAKAINNALSALSLTVTAEVIAIGSLAGLDATKIVDVINQGFGRSQNSEVKYPRYILSGTYASQFLLSQMLKDIGVACGMAAASDIPVPMTAVLGQIWRAALANLGLAADSTQIAQFLATPASGNGHLDRANPDRPLDTTMEQLNLALFAACFIGALELLTLGERYHLDRDRLLAIINASSGRSEATRSLVARNDGSRGSSTVTIRRVMDALGWGQALAARARLFVPMTALAAELLRQAGQKLGRETDLQMLASRPVVA